LRLHAHTRWQPTRRFNASDADQPPIIVQKFGGTSLGTPEKLEKVIKIVSKFHAESRVACVVSALSSHTKAEGTTSRLLAAADHAVAQAPFYQYLDAIEDTHLDIVYTMLRKHENRELVKQHITKVAASSTAALVWGSAAADPRPVSGCVCVCVCVCVCRNCAW
jgi:aspartokinase